MIEELIRLVPPPAEPKNVPSAEEWVQYEAALGCVFPPDYKQIINIYGDGWFADWIHLESPNRIIESVIEGSTPLDFGIWENPYLLFPAPGGLLLAGRDDGNSFFAWDTQNTSDQWTLINFDNDFREGEDIALNVGWLELLVGWFVGTISNPEVGNQWYPEDIEPTQERFFRQS